MPGERRERPVVGITPDAGQTSPGPGRPAVARYELKQAYADAVLAAGGLPVVLPYAEDEGAVAAAAALCDALVVTGGAFDIPPDLYGAQGHRLLGPLKPSRTQFEQRLLRAFVAAGRPVLGICGGMQLLAAEVGGTLWQDIRDELPGAFDHEQKHDPAQPAHAIRIEPGTRLAAVVGSSSLEVNSTHHQAVREPGRARVSATSTDGVIEAIELPGAAFVVGVQWHPELLRLPAHQALYQALVDAARGRR